MTEHCAYCEVSETERKLVRDHVVPRRRGGPDHPRNIVLACESCNAQKSDKLPSEWLGTLVPRVIAEIEARVCKTVEVSFAKRTRRAIRPRAAIEHQEPLMCWYCDEPIVGTEGAIEIVDIEMPKGMLSPLDRRAKREEYTARRISYPGTGEHRTKAGAWYGYMRLVFLTHFDCNPDSQGYWVGLRDLSKDWEGHLSAKRWHFDGIDELIRDLRQRFGVTLERRAV